MTKQFFDIAVVARLPAVAQFEVTYIQPIVERLAIININDHQSDNTPGQEG